MGKLPQDNQKDDEDRDPTPLLIPMDNFVAEQGDDAGAGGDDNDARPSGNVAADCIEQLSADNTVDCGPTNSCYGIEDSDCIS